MNISFASSKTSSLSKHCKYIKVTSDDDGGDIVIKHFIDIWQAGMELQSVNASCVVIDTTLLDKRFKIGFLNRAIQGLYRFNHYRSSKTNSKVVIIDPSFSKNEAIKTIATLQVANEVRDLANEPANVSFPETFCDYTKEYFKDMQHTTITIFDQEQLAKKNFGLISAVGSGSKHLPRLLVIDYNPPNAKKCICLVGKGVTMDTGGYQIKVRPHMKGMHLDDTGASIVVGLVKQSITSGDIKHRVVGICPLVENAVSSIAMKPGDIVTAVNGKTVEIVDTDAEGRLILADALAYACKEYKPDYLIDFATLTGWSSDLHCHTSYVFFTLNDIFANKIFDIGEKVAERSMRMPSWVEYQQMTKSDVADYKNYGFKKCPNSDGFMAAMFLLNFIPSKYHTKWVHFDIKHLSIQPTVGVAEGFLTGVEFLRTL